MAEKDTRIKDIENMHNNIFEIEEGEFKNLNQWVNVKCLKCGYEWRTKLSSLKYRGYCPMCRKNEKLEKIHETQYSFHYDRCKKICEERGYTFYDVFKKGKLWNVRFDTNQSDRNGIPYGIVNQNELSFINDLYVKTQASDKVAMPQEEFISKAISVHPELDFSKTVYVNNHTSINVECPKHGIFSVSPKEVLKSEYECAKCKKERTLKEDSNDVYKQLINLYGDKGFKFDMSNYKGLKYDIECECPEHGSFKQTPYFLLRGRGCRKCGFKKRGDSKRIDTETFIKKAKEIRTDRDDDFSNAVYVNTHTPLKLICNKVDKYGRTHGEYNVTPDAYLHGQSCPKCSGKHRMDLNEFKEIASIIHKDKYDYSKIKEYNGIYSKVEIICHEVDECGREHGPFFQTVKNHLNGFGCKKCSNTYMDLELFKYRANKTHGNKYIYDLVTEYLGNTTKLPIICPEHGVFMQTPMCHIQGQGCPYCKESHLERSVNLALEENGFNKEREKRFEWLINDKTGYRLPLDFYITDYNIAIECQGEQHFISNYYKSKGDEYAEKHLEGVQYRDEIKRKLCKANGIPLIYFLENKFVKFLKPDDVFFTKVEDLISYIKSIKQ